jgi:hypothetical protein
VIGAEMFRSENWEERVQVAGGKLEVSWRGKLNLSQVVGRRKSIMAVKDCIMRSDE